MEFYVTDHLSHRALLLDLRTSRGSETRSTAVVLSRIAEVDTRRLYLQEGYPSMYEFLIHDLHYTEGSAYKRLYAARAAHKFPLLYFAVAEGKLHLSAVVMLAKYLTDGNLVELIEAATHKTKAEIAQLIANRFPRRDLPEIMVPSAPGPVAAAEIMHLSPGTVDATPSPFASDCAAPASQLSPGTVPPIPAPRMTPRAPQGFSLECIDQETRELWQRGKSLLSHQIPNGEMGLVLKKLLEIAVDQLEKKRCAKTDRPRPSKARVDSRHVPAVEKRVAWARDEGKCTFVSETGRRCGSDYQPELHHNDEFALGGLSTAKNLRILCRAHNEHLAEKTFGAEFMERKRAAAREAAAKRRAAKQP